MSRTQAWLMRSEAENNMILGIASALARDPSFVKEAPYLASVELDAEVVTCALRTPPHKLALTRCGNREAVALLTADALSAYPDLAAAFGPEPDVEAFAAAWSDLSGRRVQRGMRQRIHEARRVEAMRNSPPGALRPATASDLEVVVPWISGFFDDLPEVQREDPAEVARARIRHEALFVWDDRGPVSMAGWSGKTPNGVRVNLVYTPHERRSRGYATACVSALTRRLLASGNSFCCLYTNLANPISNRLYHRIGYRPVCDVSDVSVAPR